jgi:hypothetical protein
MSCILRAICCCCYPKEPIDSHRPPTENDPLMRHRRKDSDGEGSRSEPGTPDSAYKTQTYQGTLVQVSPYRGNTRDKV